MKWPDIYLLCFAIGTIWSVATILLGGLHFGHGHAAHFHHGHAHAPGAHHHSDPSGGWLAALISPNSLAVFLAWFGGVGYVLTRHTGLLLWTDLALAIVFGLAGAWLLASFLHFLQVREKPLDPSDYEMIGVLGHVSSTIRPDGVGELIYTRDGARRPVCARSEDGSFIGRGAEVVVTRFERGVAYVRTFEAMMAQPPLPAEKEKENVD
ncbi:MAG TPA: NfeD family protein [Bryobacteraceae bacterium]|jgi:membrane protein implicated in regulation of membrane protease activity